MQNINELYMLIPKDKRRDLRFMAKLLGKKSEKEIREYAVETWQGKQRADGDHISQK